jgi:hypothetical protein
MRWFHGPDARTNTGKTPTSNAKREGMEQLLCAFTWALLPDMEETTL